MLQLPYRAPSYDVPAQPLGCRGRTRTKSNKTLRARQLLPQTQLRIRRKKISKTSALRVHEEVLVSLTHVCHICSLAGAAELELSSTKAHVTVL